MSDSNRFKGDPEHFAKFMNLVESPIHSDERGHALDEWRTFNRVATLPPGADPTKKVAMWQAYQKAREVDLRGIDLTYAFLGKADLQGADLTGAVLNGARLKRAHFDGATLDAADLSEALLLGTTFEEASLKNATLKNVDGADATFRGANLVGADLSGSNLAGVDFSGADLTGANLSDTDLANSVFVGTNVTDAIFDRATVYGLSAWDLAGEPASSQSLRITREAPAITVENLKVAQFVYMMYRNPEIREVLDTVTRKVVLILGRFTEERKAVLDSLRTALRDFDLVPVVFDFEKPADRNLTETVTVLAKMARFVVADLTDPKSVPHELKAIAPSVAVPIRLIIQADEEPYSMVGDLYDHYWVLPPFRYDSREHLLASLETDVIQPSEDCRKAISERRSARAR